MKALDLFPKATPAALRKTSEGAAISLCAVLLVVVLVVFETVRFTSVQVRERLDLAERHRDGDETSVEISFSVDFFAIPCSKVKFAALTKGVDEPHDISNAVNKTPAFGDQGCATAGTIVVPRAAGDFHVALNPRMLNPFQSGITLDDYKHFNASHRINHFRIDGNTNKGSLDGVERIFNITGATATYTYELHVVATIYRDLKNQTSSSNLFRLNAQEILTVSETDAAIAVSKLGLPGVYFSYKFSPMILVKWEERIPFAEYVANLLAIFGGVTTVVALFDTVLHESLLKHKLD